MEVLRGAVRSIERVAVCTTGNEFGYGNILQRALQAAQVLKKCREVDKKPKGRGRGPRVAVLAPPGPEYVSATLAAWLSGSIAVPLCLSHPPNELKYVLEDAEVSVVLSAAEYFQSMAPLAHAVGAKVHLLDDQGSSNGFVDIGIQVEAMLSSAHEDDGSLIIYTSGTTGRPKGALHTHRSIDAQVAGLCSSWGWQPADRILHALPLHHIHGIVNALLCPLATGATIEFLPKFSPTRVWQHLQREPDPITVFMGVPTMYSYLLSAYDAMGKLEQEQATLAASRLRLTVSGSAACPVPVMERWRSLSGQNLLERYGMTETGMILSNPYRGERRPGFVGLPLPGVTVKVLPEGELAVCGNNVFSEYWNRPDATRDSFDAEGYFLTGDTAAMEGEPPYWRILGRTSTDIIKSGGYKMSALQIEDALLSHPHVSHCAVLGVPDDNLGESVAAVVSCGAVKVSEAEVIEFAAKLLPKYQIPSQVLVVDEIPRNAMGKINKKALREQMFP